MSSPTSRTTAYLRDHGWEPDIVEKWNAFTKTRKDLYGVIDIVCCDGKTPIIGVQATSTGNVGARLDKAKAEPRLVKWLRSGGRFLVVGWAKRGRQGERKLWTPRWVELLLGSDGYSTVELQSL